MANPRNPTVAISAARKRKSDGLSATLGERLASAQLVMTYRSPLTNNVISTGREVKTSQGTLPEADPKAEAYYCEIQTRLSGIRERNRLCPFARLIWNISEDESRMFSGGSSPDHPIASRRTRDR